MFDAVDGQEREEYLRVIKKKKKKSENEMCEWRFSFFFFFFCVGFPTFLVDDSWVQQAEHGEVSFDLWMTLEEVVGVFFFPGLKLGKINGFR